MGLLNWVAYDVYRSATRSSGPLYDNERQARAKGRAWADRVLGASVLAHPDLWRRVDGRAWEDQLTGEYLRMARVRLVRGAYQRGPLFAAQAALEVRLRARKVNDEFRRAGWDVDGLLADLPRVRGERTSQCAEAEARRRGRMVPQPPQR